MSEETEAPAVESDDEIEDATSETSRKKYGARPLSVPGVMAEIIAHLEHDTKTAKEIIAEYGCSRAALWKRLADLKEVGKFGGVGCKAKEIAERIEKEAVAAGIAKRVAEGVDLPGPTWEEQRATRIAQFKKTVAAMTMANVSLHQEIIKEIKSGAKTLDNSANALKALRHSQKVIGEGWDNMFKALDMATVVDEESLPTLIVRDLTQEEIDAKQSDDDDDDDIGLPEEPPLDDDVMEEGS